MAMVPPRENTATRLGEEWVAVIVSFLLAEAGMGDQRSQPSRAAGLRPSMPVKRERLSHWWTAAGLRFTLAYAYPSCRYRARPLSSASSAALALHQT